MPRSPRLLLAIFFALVLPSSSFLLSPSRSRSALLRPTGKSQSKLWIGNDDDDDVELIDEGVSDEVTDEDIREMQALDNPLTRTLQIIGVNNPFSTLLALTTLTIIILNNVLGVGWLTEYAKDNKFNDEGAAQVQKQVIREPPIGSDLARELDKVGYERRDINWGNTKEGEIKGEPIIAGKDGDGGGYLLPFRR
ncbi:hypothetical protein TrLO_g3764 [Triparma laevis f. longispina]|uniref:Uncharacterized protein n=1 Tax=Triparma laevis f. longispina TaxID=1714387 RepID=A0A9W7KZB7_9STRA|nr:hypothetical protein TrLO_g3764 [Triparma laevis f. longispina]